MPSRRRVLAAFGASALAGCAGETGTETDGTATTTTSPTASQPASPAAVGEPVTVDDATLTLERVAVRDSLFVQASADSKDVMTEEGERFLLTTVSVEGDGPSSASAFSLAVDDDVVETGSTSFAENHYGYLGRWPYDPTGERGEPGGWVGFTPPAPLSDDSMTVTVDDAAWQLPQDAVERLQQPRTTYDLVSFDYPETVRPEETFTVSVTAENTGPVAGTFRGVLNVSYIEYAHYPYPFELDVPAGERRTWEKTFDAATVQGGGTGGLHLRTPAEDRDGEVEVVAETGTATD